MKPAHRTLHRRADITRDRGRQANTELEAGEQYSAGELPEIRLLDEHEVSRRLSVSVNTLRYWRACGDGPNYVKLGRLVRYDSGALEKFILRNLRVSKARATAEEKRVAL
jgi:predicted DNA-binding transcriptional regulator AlpA